MRLFMWLGGWTALMLLSVALPCATANGASLSGRSSTVVEVFEAPNDKTALPLYEYLLLNARDVGVQNLDFRGYGRLGYDPTDESDADSRLYYAYFEKKDLPWDFGLKAGRQFVRSAAGASLIDGVDLIWKGSEIFSFELFGGGDVSLNDDYEAGDFLWGAEFSAEPNEDLDLSLSYVQVWDENDLARELFGLDAEYVFRDLMRLYTEVQYNYLSEAVTYFVLGGKYYRNPKWALRGHYLYSVPVFDSTSIYSVFAVSEYQEAMVETDFVLKPALRAYIRYTREIYDEYSDADVVEAGIEKLRTERIFGYLAGTVRKDEDGQDLWGVKTRVAYRLLSSLQIGAGVHLDVLERRLDDRDDDHTTSSRIWTEALYNLSDKITFDGKVERMESDLYDEYYSGRVRMNVRF